MRRWIAASVSLLSSLLLASAALAVDDDMGTRVVPPGGSGSGSAITVDLGDDGGNDTTAMNEIATTGTDTNSIFTVSVNKFLIDVDADWPQADLADTSVVVDGTDATSFPAIFDSATGNLAVKTDAGLTYDASNGTLSSTILTEGANAVFNSSETPGGELGGTWGTPTIDDGLTVDGWTLTAAAAITSSGLITGNAGFLGANGATSGGFLDLKEDSDDGTSKIRLIAPALAGDVTLTLPVNDGDADQVLTTNGSGVLSWAAAGAGSGDITDVWGCSSGNCNAITGASGDSFNATSADSSIPMVVGTSCSSHTAEGRQCWESDRDLLWQGNGSTAQIVGGSLGVRVTPSGNQTITTGTDTALTWDTESYDDDAMHFTSAAALTGTVDKTATSTTLAGTGTAFTTELAVGQLITVPGTATEIRVVTAVASDTSLTVQTAFDNTATGQTATRRNFGLVMTEAGRYYVVCNVQYNGNATGRREVYILRNGAQGFSPLGTRLGQSWTEPDGSTVDAQVNLSTVYNFAKWDYVTCNTRHDIGSDGTVEPGSGENTHFAIQRMN